MLHGQRPDRQYLGPVCSGWPEDQSKLSNLNIISISLMLDVMVILMKNINRMGVGKRWEYKILVFLSGLFPLL